MKSQNFLYDNFIKFQDNILSLDFDLEKKYHILIHTSCLNREECLELAKNMRALFPNSTITGAPTSGVIFNGEIHENRILTVITEFEYGEVRTTINSSLDKKSNEIALDIKKFVDAFPSQFGILLFDLKHNNLTQITEHINKELPNVSFVGGIAGTALESGELDSFIFDDTGYYENSYSITLLSKNFILPYTNTVIGHPSISKTFTITKTNGDIIEEIDSMNAVKWINQHLGIQDFVENSDWKSTVSTDILLKFPIVLDGLNSSTRFMQYDKKNNSLHLYFNTLEAGQKFSIGYSSPLKSTEEWQEVCYDLQTTSAEFMFCYSCLFRKIFSNNIAKWEMKAFKNTNICGAFLLGEIGTKNNSVEFLNGGSSIFTLAENENYIKPNIAAFKLNDSIIESNSDMIGQIELVGNRLQKDNKIFNALIEHEKDIKNRVLYTKDAQFEPILELLKEQIHNAKKQICLISIGNKEEQIEILGIKKFEDFAKENRAQIVEFIKSSHPQINCKFYNYDTANFVFTIDEKINDDKFITVVKDIYENCGIYKSADETALFINNFTFTVKGLSIQSMFDISKSENLNISQKRFNLCDKSNVELDNLQEEFEMVSLLNSIIKAKTVVPHFQSIYDNQNNTIFAYEALVRLQTPEGKILFPRDFIAIAEKYKLQLPINILLIEKIFELFQYRDEIISINITSSDILSQDFQDKIFDNLKILKNPQNFIFEFMNIKECHDDVKIKHFIHRLKQYGCKITTGNSKESSANFLDLGPFGFDMLKIDSSLTKLLGTDANYTNILEGIVFTAQKLNVKLIASFVETASVQKQLVRSGVQYSQGYFFSNPIPFNKLEILSKENTYKLQQKINNEDDFFHSEINKKQENRKAKVLFWSSIALLITFLISIFIFLGFNREKALKMNNETIEKHTLNISSEINLMVRYTKSNFKLINKILADDIDDKEEIYKKLKTIKSGSIFDELYISFDGKNALNCDKKPFDIDIEGIYGKIKDNEIKFLPIITTREKKQKVLILGSNIYKNNKKVAELYGVLTVQKIARLLNIKYIENGRSTLLRPNETQVDIDEDILELFPEEVEKIFSIKLAALDLKPTNITKEVILLSLFILLIFIIYFNLNLYMYAIKNKILLKELNNSKSLANSLQLSIETDSLTNTYSRLSAIEKISEKIISNHEQNKINALVVIDIDNFKYINDTFGHNTGDIYLQDFVSAIKLAINRGSILGRLGGDEFILLIDNIENKSDAEEILDMIFENVADISRANPLLNKAGVSAGVVLIKENKCSYEELMINADKALYEAKNSGKNKYIFFEKEEDITPSI